MTYFAIIFVSLIVLTSGIVLFRKSQKPKTISLAEGIYFNYLTLVEHLLNVDNRAHLADIKLGSLRILIPGAKDSASFFLTEVEGKIIVVWTWSGSVFGPRGKEWSFAKDEDQEKMIRQILRDVEDYKTSIYRGHNLRIPLKVG
jgi:hypothetical protein